MVALSPQPLQAEAFAPFGEVIAAAGAFTRINNGSAQHYADLAPIDVAREGGRARVGIYRARPVALPLPIRMLERHPLGSQLFMPLDGQCFLIVVAPAGDTVEPAAIRAFVSNGHQGVNYRRGTWHHPLLALGQECDFLVLDRAGAGANCDEIAISAELYLTSS
jgi:ureidoglycolate lyase